VDSRGVDRRAGLATREPAHVARNRVRARRASLAILVLTLWGWQFRTTGALSIAAAALLAGSVWVFAASGLVLARESARIVAFRPGIACELLIGFFFANTLLFVLVLLSPFGMGVDVSLMGLVGLAATLLGRSKRYAPRTTLCAEYGSLVCIAFTAGAATLWVGDQQPVMTIVAGKEIFTVWADLFIHASQISTFAHAHGLRTIEDIRLAGTPASVYHFASYMMPAALDAVTSTSAIDSYAAFQLPFGIFLVGLAGYVLPSVLLRTVWPAVLGSAALLALPDAYGQGFGVRLLSFHFMSQVNLTMLYGLACISLAWIFMIEGCRRRTVIGAAVAYALLATCLSYKAHLFVANALLLMLYPLAFLQPSRRPIRIRWRIGAAVVATAIFAAVVVVSQSSPRVPTLRLDGSGLPAYVDILMTTVADGPGKRWFEAMYHRPDVAGSVHGIAAALLILFGSFGVWVLLTPFSLWKSRHAVPPRVAVFVLLVFVNYMVMSLFLALDEPGVAAREELVNRPQAWAYFVVVSLSVAALALASWGRRRRPPLAAHALALPVACAAFLGIHAQSDRLETFPEWPGYGSYAEFNSVPTCVVRAAHFVRDNADVADIVQDSRLDPEFAFKANAERREFISVRPFGSASELVDERAKVVEASQRRDDGADLVSWARSNGVAWFLMHPEDGLDKDARFLDRAVFVCDGYRLFHFAR
jgi:hypothetical protein